MRLRLYRTQSDGAPTMLFLSDRQIAERFGIARQTIWRWAQAGNFPQPVKLGPCVTRWKAADVDAWLADREGAA